jgi:UDP-GlcNAc:undecaprenyl-phosphate GlcNAc-1-phosphate transferase
LDDGMNLLATTFFVTFLASLLLTVTVRKIARRWGVVDFPDGQRKLHPQPVALWGGIAVYLALVLGLIVAACSTLGGGQPLGELSVVLGISAGIVCICGAVDDWRCLTPRCKLLLQICSVLPIVAFGYWIDRIVAFGYPIQLGWWGIPLTVAWLVGCINALNLLDGMDGLSSTVGLLTATMMGLIASSMGHDHVVVIAVVLAGSLAGFLVHNLPPASIFLGDSGSMVIGLVLGVLGMQGALKTSATLAITMPAVVMSLPMFDTVLALVRRKLTGRPFDAADRQHIHHRLLDQGFTQWQTLCLLGAMCLATGAAATAATIFRNDALAWITALTLLTLVVRLRLFGYHEFQLGKRALARGLAELAHRLSATGPLRRIPRAAKLTRLPFDEAWTMLIEEVRNFNVCRLELSVSSHGQLSRRHTWNDLAPAADADDLTDWSIAITLRQPGGRVCEMRASGLDALEPELASSTGLTRLLTAFGTHFSEHFAQVPGLAVIGTDHGRSDADPRRRNRAA